MTQNKFIIDFYDDFQLDLEIEIAEKLVLLPNGMTWEDKSEKLSQKVMKFLREKANQ